LRVRPPQLPTPSVPPHQKKPQKRSKLDPKVSAISSKALKALLPSAEPLKLSDVVRLPSMNPRAGESQVPMDRSPDDTSDEDMALLGSYPAPMRTSPDKRSKSVPELQLKRQTPFSAHALFSAYPNEEAPQVRRLAQPISPELAKIHSSSPQPTERPRQAPGSAEKMLMSRTFSGSNDKKSAPREAPF